jgi:hypothetical protein
VLPFVLLLLPFCWQLPTQFHFVLQGVPTLTIGHHRLVGALVDLKKPLAVVQKERCTEHTQKARKLDGPETLLKYTVAGLVRKKLVFQQRPLHIIGSAQ